MNKLNNYKFEIEESNFDSFVGNISELSKLGDMVKFKLDTDGYMLMYSVNAKNTQSPIHAFKGIITEIDKMFSPKSDMPDTGLNFLMLNPKTFVKNVKLFDTDNIAGVFKYREDKTDAHEMTIHSGKLKLNFVGGDPTIMKDLSRKQIESLINPDNAEFTFDIEKGDLIKIKKLSTSSVGNDIVNFIIKDSILTVGDSKWNLEIGSCNYADKKLTINKKHLNSIENMDKVNINVYDRFIVISNEKTMLMISLELDDL